MKNLKVIISLLLLGLFINEASAQKIKVEKGEMSSFIGITELNIEYDYSDMGVGKFKTEDEYIAKKKKDYNKDEAGKGNTWESEWHADKENTYQPNFEKMFNLIMLSAQTGTELGIFPDAEYTLIMKTTFLEPGYNVGISSKNASINLEILLVKTEDPSNVLTSISMTKVPGSGFFGNDFDSEQRIGEAYSNGGRELAQYICKKTL